MTATALPILPHYQAAVAAGAECWRCPLMGNSAGGPVPATIPYGATFYVVAEAPSVTEVEQGKPLIGASGKEVRRAIANAGADSERVAYTNSIMCRPPGDLKKYLQQAKKRGAASPIECCRPRLQNELRNARFVLLMGGASLTAAGISKSVMSIRGTPTTTASGLSAIATPHAAFVLRDDGARYRPVFAADVAKAVRISRSGSTWRDPWYFVPKSAAEVSNFLSVNRPRVAVDVETDGIDRWSCQLRRVGIGTDSEVLIYSPLSVRGHALLSSDETVAQARVIADYFQRAPRTDTHNGTAFDSVILHRYGMPLVDGRGLDGLIGHQIGYTSELPHRLDFLASMYTDAPSWKQDTKHSNVSSDEALDKYLSFDIATTFTCTAYVEQNLVSANQGHVYAIDHELYQIGRSMSALGILIDPAKRFEFATEYQTKSDKLRAEFNAVAGADVNPASVPQVRKLLYNTLGLPVLDDHITDSEEPSTDENTLLDLLTMADARASKVIHGLIGYREAEKILSTNTGHIVDGRLEGGPPAHVDGRLRTTWRPGKVTGRWGSSDPINLQNIGKKLRAMYVAAPGNVLVAADMSAVELRKVAELANDEPLIKAFAAFDNKTGPDVHVNNACGLFRCQPGDVNDEVRRFTKCVAAGSRVAVPGRGLLRIEELVAGTPVLTEKGTATATEWTDVGNEPCVTIRTSGGPAITVARRHRIQLWDKTWKWAEDVQPDDKLALVFPESTISKDYVRIKINPWIARKSKSRPDYDHTLPALPDLVIEERLAYLLGVTLGDGGLTGEGSYLVGLARDGVIAEATRCAHELGLTTSYHVRSNTSEAGEFGVLSIRAPNWAMLLRRLGMSTKHDKTTKYKKVMHVPDEIFRSPRSVIVSFLAGLYDTDGSVGELSICSKSEEFIRQLSLLHAMLGMRGYFSESFNKPYKRMYYILRFRRSAARKFVGMGGMRAAGKLARQHVKMEAWGDRAIDPRPYWKVSRVDDAGIQHVYDLTVPETNSYVANAMVQHNSFVYALTYAAEPPKIYQTLSLLRDDNLKPLFPGITLQEIERVYALYWQLHPAIPTWRKKLTHMWRAQRYLQTQFHKRRRYFIGGESTTEFPAFMVSGSCADMHNDAIRAFVREYPFDFVNHRGLLVNGHDQLVAECAEYEVEHVKGIMKRVMEKHSGGVFYPAEPKVGRDWKAVS